MRGVDVSAHGGDNGVVNSLQQGSLDSGVVDQGSVDRGFVDDGLVDSGSIDQGGVSLSLGLTLGDVRHNGGGLQAGEYLAQDGSGQSGVVDTGNCVGQGSLDSRVVDHGSVDGRIVDNRFVEGEGVCVDSLLSLLSHREGLVNHWSLDGRVVDDGLVQTSSVDQVRVVDSRGEGQSVGGVDQSWVRFRLSHGHGDKSENCKELHAEACLDCLLPTVPC